MIPQLGADSASGFPDPAIALESPDGLLAWGGDLDPVRLGNAYHNGIFPWYSDDQPILWWSPSNRCVIFPDKVYVSKRLARLISQQKYQLTANQAFKQVMKGCALPRESQESTWITSDMVDAYCQLHKLGLAHSVEVWEGDTLAGGIYGLAIGKMFFGESMFSKARDASKVALVGLCRILEQKKFALLDCQVSNPHLESMGATDIPRETFLAILAANINLPSAQYLFEGEFK
jgi:leucyl/phenylalanyl-tRNA--protein transferase